MAPLLEVRNLKTYFRQTQDGVVKKRWTASSYECHPGRKTIALVGRERLRENRFLPSLFYVWWRKKEPAVENSSGEMLF